MVEDGSEHKNGVNKNVVAKLSQSKCKNVLLNRIQSKNYKIGTFEISKICFPSFDDKIYILNKRCDELAFGY